MAEAIPHGSRVALLDEPVHRNVGDHLIHLGTERFCRENGMAVVARAHVHNYEPRRLRRRIGRDAVLVCSGGGHLGDLYPRHQRLREQLTLDFPDHRIVVLPQSLYFRSEERMRRAAAIFRGHGDFHLFLRDDDSRQRAEAMQLRNLYLAPDMAHALHPLHPAAPPAEPHGGDATLYLLRRDREATASGQRPDGPVRDWPDLVRLRHTAALAAVAAGSRLLRPAEPDFLDRLLDRQRADLVERAIDLVSGYRRIVTSRLHGALLGLLLGRRVRLLASLTGKSAAYCSTWLADCPACTYEPDPADAGRR